MVRGVMGTVDEVNATLAGGRLQYDDDGKPIERIATCGVCGRSWNDALITSITPTPSGRCPYEYAHSDDEQHRARARQVRLGTLHIDITGEALRRLTRDQRNTLIRLTQDSAWQQVLVGTSWDLPDDWITFDLLGPGRLFGGIDPEGGANT